MTTALHRKKIYFLAAVSAGLSGLVAAQDFRLQVAAYADSMPSVYFREKGLNTVIATYDQIGLYRYFAGSYKTREAARFAQEELIQKGFPHAQIIDLEEQRILCGADCPYFRNGVVFVKDTAQDQTVRNIYFDFGRYSLNTESKAELNVVAQWLKEDKGAKLGILGYTDGVGSAQANVELATSRARSARNYLINKGIRADRMFIKVFGEADPDAPNADDLGNDLPENRKWNRRVALAILDEAGEVKIGRRNLQAKGH
jgi:outer membrane protein OmpA-like peptidoglycan-associated protein